RPLLVSPLDTHCIFYHVTAEMVWIGGSATIQVFGILSKRASRSGEDSVRRSERLVDRRAHLPSGVDRRPSRGSRLTIEGNWSWSEPFIVYGLVFWALASLVAF